MDAFRIIVLSFLLCLQFGISVLQVTLKPGEVTVDCSKVTADSIVNLEITLPTGLAAKTGDSACTLTSEGANKYKAIGCAQQTALTVLVLMEGDASKNVVTEDIKYFNVSCIDGGTEKAKSAVMGMDEKPLDILPKVDLVLSKGDPKTISKISDIIQAIKPAYQESLYLTFELKHGASKTLIPLSCEAIGKSHRSEKLFDISVDVPKQCIKQNSVMKEMSSGLFIEKKLIGTTAVTYAKFSVFSFIEPSPTVTISCQVRVCDTKWTSGTASAGLCKSDFKKMNECKASSTTRRRRDVKRATRMTGGQEHGQVHRVSTSYSIQEKIGATGGSNMISQTFSMLLASFLILFL